MSSRKTVKPRGSGTGRVANVSNDFPMRIARRKEDFVSAFPNDVEDPENHPVQILSVGALSSDLKDQTGGLRESTSPSTRLTRPATKSIIFNNNRDNERTLLLDDKSIKPKAASTFPDMKLMVDALRLIEDDDNMNFLDFVKEYLLDENKIYTVIGAVGAQGAGKSTILSMLAGNDCFDMYRQYVFRPCSREGMESCRYQTTKIYVYINKCRTIFLDCQGIGNSSLFEEYVRLRRRQNQPAEQFELASLQLLTLLANVCHTLLLCVDWFIDDNVVRDLLRTEMFLPLEMNAETANRKVNIVVVHNRAKSEAFEPLVVTERMSILKGMFENSKFNICGGVNMAGLGFARYRLIDSDVNYVLLSEMKMKKAQNTPEADVMTSVIDYAKVISVLRVKILALSKPSFPNCMEKISETGWFQFAAVLWDKILKELPNTFEETKSSEFSRFRRYSSRINNNDYNYSSSSQRRRGLRNFNDSITPKSPGSGLISLRFDSSQNMPSSSRTLMFKSSSGKLRRRVPNRPRKTANDRLGERSRRRLFDAKTEYDVNHFNDEILPSTQHWQNKLKTQRKSDDAALDTRSLADDDDEYSNHEDSKKDWNYREINEKLSSSQSPKDHPKSSS